MKPILHLWCDLETTGFDPESGYLMEASFELCHPDGDAILEATTAIALPTLFPLNEVWQKHRETGLLLRCQDEGVPRRSEFDLDFSRALANAKVRHGMPNVVLAGSSIHFDRGWIKKHLPLTEKELHYRMIDNRVVFMLMEQCGIPFNPPHVSGTIHTAKADRDWAKGAWFEAVRVLRGMC